MISKLLHRPDLQACFNCEPQLQPKEEVRRKGCPERILTPLFPGPVSPLSPEKLKELKLQIARANDILRALGNPRDPDQLRAFQLKLLANRGQFLHLKVENERRNLDVKGFLIESGKDYLQLSGHKWLTFVLYTNIIKIEGLLCPGPPIVHDPHLPCLNEQQRRDLTLNFGKVVSGNIDLLNAFFGIPLSIALVPFTCRNILVILQDGSVETGTILKVKEDELLLKSAERRSVKRIKLDDISVLKVKKGL